MTQNNAALKKEKRIFSTDLSRGVAIILIVWAHVDLRMDAFFYKKNLELLHYFIYSFHVPLLFIISAALFRRSIKLSVDFFNFLKKISFRILLPFFSLSIIFLFFKSVSSESLQLLHSPDTMEMITALMLRQSDVTKMPSGVLWFFFALFVFSLLIYLFHKKLEVNIYLILLIAILMRLVSPYFDKVHILCAQKVFKMFLFFVIGYIYSGFILKGEIGRKKIFFPLFFIIWFIAFLYMPKYQAMSPPVAGAITGIAGSFFVIGVCFELKQYAENIILKFIGFCGQNSVLIYVFHTSVAVLVAKALDYLSISNSFFGFFIMLAGGVLLPLLIGKIISFNASIYRVLFGRYPVYSKSVRSN